MASSNPFAQSFRSKENNTIQRNCEAVQSSTNLTIPPFEPKKFESVEEIKARVLATQEHTAFKSRNEHLDKKIIELNDKMKCMKEENTYLYKKI